MTVKLSININDATRDALLDLALRRGSNVTEVMRRAVGVYKTLSDDVVDGDWGLVLVAPDGSEARLTIV